MTRIDVTVRTSASAAAVYRLVHDNSTWPDWSPIDSFELERAAPGDDPYGVGSVRVFRTRTGLKEYVTREEIVELDPGHRQSYILLSGLAIRDYRAYVDVEESNGGTTIHWYADFAPKVPGTGWIYRAMLSKVIGDYARGLATYAEKEA